MERLTHAKAPHSVPVRNEAGEIIGEATFEITEDGRGVFSWTPPSDLPVGPYTIDETEIDWTP